MIMLFLSMPACGAAAAALAECEVCGGDGLCNACGGRGFWEAKAFATGETVRIKCTNQDCLDGLCAVCSNEGGVQTFKNSLESQQEETRDNQDRWILYDKELSGSGILFDAQNTEELTLAYYAHQTMKKMAEAQADCFAVTGSGYGLVLDTGDADTLLHNGFLYLDKASRLRCVSKKTCFQRFMI